MSEEDPPAKRMRLGGDGLLELTKEELIAENKKQESYIATLLSRLDGTCTSGHQNELEERLKQQQAEANRKEKVLLMQLTRKEQELQELATQLGELTKGNTPGASQLRAALLDPALNLLFQRMRNQLEEKSKKLQQATDDMAAWKFTPDSQTGKRLMSKCRTLIQENQELGKQVSTGRTAQLEAELALQKKYSEELKASQDELNEFVIQLDEEVEGMQSTICALQQQLKEAKDSKQELATLKATRTEPMASNQAAPEKQVHEQVAQQGLEQHVQPPESPVSEQGTIPTLLSPALASQPEGEAAGNRTPEAELGCEAGKEASFVPEGTGDEIPRPWTPDKMETMTPVEESSPWDDRTADGTNMSPIEEHERTRSTPDDEKERTTKISEERVRTFSYEDSETQEQQQEEMSYQVMGEDQQDAIHEECQEQQVRCQQWDKQQQDQQQQQDKAEEQMEIDSPKCKNDSSSKENEAFLIDTKQSKFVGELTSPVASCETLTSGSNATTPDHVQTSQNQGVDPAPGDTHNIDPTSLEPSGNIDLGVIDSTSNKGTEGSSTKNLEVQDISTNNQDNAVTSSQAEEVNKSTFDSQPTLGKAVGESQGIGQLALVTQLSEAKVTAKKLPPNCNLSVVDYDTGSSEEDEGDNDGFVEEPSRPSNKALPPTKHSPNNQSPESPNQSLSPENNSLGPLNNTGKLESDVSPHNNMQVSSNNGSSELGLLIKVNDTRDSDIVEENGTDSVHNNEHVAMSTE